MTLDEIQTQPNERELELRVLGMIMNYSDLLENTVITASDFYSNDNGIVFETMHRMHGASMEINYMTVKSELKKIYKRKNFGIEDINTSFMGMSTFVDDVARLKEYAKYRAIVNIAGNIKNRAMEMADIEIITKDIDTLIGAGSDTNINTVNMAKSVDDAIDAIISDRIDSVPLGYQKLDDMIPGFRPGQLVIIAGRPGAGKTASMLNLGYKQAELGYKVGILSLEMSGTELIHRLFSLGGQIPFNRISSKSITDEDRDKIVGVAKDIVDKGMIIVDDSYSMGSIGAKCKSLVGLHKCDIIYIDYLQLIDSGSNKNANRNNEVSQMTRELKMMAKRLNVPIVIGSQLNRGVENRIDKKPYLSDLRDSGSIEQDADIVIMLHREDYYNPEFAPNGEMDFVIRKHRNGAVGDVVLHYDAPTMSIHNEKPKKDDPF